MFNGNDFKRAFDVFGNIREVFGVFLRDEDGF